MSSIRTIIKEIVIPPRKGNIRLNPEFFVLENAHIQGFLLGTGYQRMYGIDIYNSKRRHITIHTNKERRFSLDIYHISSNYPLEEFLNEFREGQFRTTLTSKQKLSLLKMLRKNLQAFAIGEEPLGKIRGHDIELYLDVERPYPPMLRRPPYPGSLETRKEIEKHINELLEMDVIRKIGNNEIMEITTPVLTTWHDGKSRLGEDLRALNNYTKAERYPTPRIPHALDKLEKSQIHNQDGLYERLPPEWMTGSRKRDGLRWKNSGGPIPTGGKTIYSSSEVLSSRINNQEAELIKLLVGHPSRFSPAKPPAKRFHSHPISSTPRKLQPVLSSIPSSVPPPSTKPSTSRPILASPMKPFPNPQPRPSPPTKLRPVASTSQRREDQSPLPFSAAQVFQNWERWPIRVIREDPNVLNEGQDSVSRLFRRVDGNSR
ncbi:hypothetical protein O181_007066 [Austropuccinia psidii MF-1]|uniref:Uncharacterized protein n=1 Tax=Austropuccinia psidii MF-1 TaxID=1389203 RepID=A0A9Q3GHA7_9BASI|nr:hypothetical protein [Austropuccinia psidii MF-1]